MPAPKILVVDDSWTDLTLIATPLRDSGYEVVTATDGDEALELVASERPQCVVLDVVLPKPWSGFQVCHKLKQNEASRHIPVILVSGKSMSIDKKWGMQMGADLYITKPFDKDQLLTGVRALIGIGI